MPVRRLVDLPVIIKRQHGSDEQIAEKLVSHSGKAKMSMRCIDCVNDTSMSDRREGRDRRTHRGSASREYAALAWHVVENPMLSGETIRLDGTIRMASLTRRRGEAA